MPLNISATDATAIFSDTGSGRWNIRYLFAGKIIIVVVIIRSLEGF